MKEQLQQLLHTTIERLQQQGSLPPVSPIEIRLERCRNPEHGDFASNIALTLAKAAQCKPRELAELIVRNLPEVAYLAKVSVAGPGFINFTLTRQAVYQVVKDILAEGDGYSRLTIGQGKKVLVESVSANPTGPLHVGHGRSAAYGACIADLLAAVGFMVIREYYVNDAGRQMNILATSVWLRYLELWGALLRFPSNGYQGDYIVEIAGVLKERYGDRFVRSIEQVFAGVRPDEGEFQGDKEVHIDDLIANAQRLLGKAEYQIIFEHGLEAILTDIRTDLAEFGVHYQQWYSERTLFESGTIEQALDVLRKTGYVEKRRGAEWFLSTAFGDDKDRVIMRENGQPTYFASDIAHHYERLQQGYAMIINVFGADHHGYVPRIKAAAECLGARSEQLIFPIVQFAVLYRGKEQVKMSTRKGEFVTLRQLYEEVGRDAARFFYIMRKADQHLNFDLELAKSQSQDNPVYYVQYAHARICSVFRQLMMKGLSWEQAEGQAHLMRLTTVEEEALITKLSQYRELLETAAITYAPHLLAQYLRELATLLHAYYNAQQFLVEDATLRNARLCLIAATRQVLASGLQLLGVSAPEQM